MSNAITVTWSMSSPSSKSEYWQLSLRIYSNSRCVKYFMMLFWIAQMMTCALVCRLSLRIDSSIKTNLAKKLSFIYGQQQSTARIVITAVISSITGALNARFMHYETAKSWEEQALEWKSTKKTKVEANIQSGVFLNITVEVLTSLCSQCDLMMVFLGSIDQKVKCNVAAVMLCWTSTVHQMWVKFFQPTWNRAVMIQLAITF